MKSVRLENSDKPAFVDDEDFDKVSKFKWYLLARGHRFYARANLSKVGGLPQRGISMHQLVTGAKGVDHKDRDGLNNTRSNLRVCTESQNSMNKKKQDGSFSKFKGVTYELKKKLWRARITINNKTIGLGRFKREEDAARAYDEAAKEHFSEFARTNAMEGIL